MIYLSLFTFMEVIFDVLSSQCILCSVVDCKSVAVVPNRLWRKPDIQCSIESGVGHSVRS